MQYDLVFEGGGAKGFVFIGALQAFEAAGHTPGRLLGTSAGAITAALVAAGYGAEEMLAALGDRSGGRSVFAGFMAPPNPFAVHEIDASAMLAALRKIDIPFLPNFLERRLDRAIVEFMAKHESLKHLVAFVERGGWYSADPFVTWMKQRLDTGSHDGKRRAYSGMTLAQFHAATGRDLTIIASDTVAGAMLVLNHRTAPDVPVAWAVRMSMSIPLVWQEVVWEPSWGKYQGRDMTGHTIVDGGLLSNFPIELLVSRNKNVLQVMGDAVCQHVIGLLIDGALPVEGAPAPAESDGAFHFAELRTVKRLANLVNTAIGARDQAVIDALADYVCHLPAGGFGTLEVEMSEARRDHLIDAGREAMEEHLAREASAAVVSFDVDADAVPAEARSAADRRALKLLAR